MYVQIPTLDGNGSFRGADGSELKCFIFQVASYSKAANMTRTFVSRESERANFCERSKAWKVRQGDLTDGLFPYVELFDLQIQRRPRNAEFGSRSIWPSDFSIAFRKSRFDQFSLIVLGFLCERT
jgi:hypothetical protein